MVGVAKTKTLSLLQGPPSGVTHRGKNFVRAVGFGTKSAELGRNRAFQQASSNLNKALKEGGKSGIIVELKSQEGDSLGFEIYLEQKKSPSLL